MPLSSPVPSRTWQFNVNQVITGEPTQAGGSADAPEYRKNILLAIKNSLVGFASNPWTVAGSSSHADNVGAMDGVDRWQDIDDIRFAKGGASQRSWIVLQNAALGIQVLFDCTTSFTSRDGLQARAWVAPTATPFTGGTSTTRPTSAAEVRVVQGDDTTNECVWAAQTENADAGRYHTLHVMHTQDGTGTRVVIFEEGVPCGLWIFDQIDNPVAPMTNSWVVAIAARGSGSRLDTFTRDFYKEGAHLYGADEAGNVQRYHIAEPSFDGAGVGQFFEGLTSIDDAYIVSPMAVMSRSAGWAAVWGTLRDTWWAPSSVGFTGRGYPTTTNATIQISDMILPWNGDTLRHK